MYSILRLQCAPTASLKHAITSTVKLWSLKNVTSRSLQTLKFPKWRPVTLKRLKLRSGLLLSSAVLCHRSLLVVAQCEDIKTSKREGGCEKEVVDGDNDGEPEFDWVYFWSILQPHMLYLVIAVISALVVAMINMQIPLQLGELTNVLSKYTTDSMASANFMQNIRRPVIKMLKAYILQGGMTCCYIWSLSCIGERVAANLRVALFHKLITQDVAFFDKHRTGELVNRLTTDIQDFKSSFKMVISQGLRSSAQTVGCLVSLYLVSPTMTGVLIGVVPTIICVGLVLGAGLRTLSRKAQSQVASATEVADEALGNMRTVRAFAMEDYEVDVYSREVEKSRLLNEQLGIGIGLFQGVTNMALNGIVLGTLGLGGYMMSTEQITAGDLMAFLVATQTIQRSLAQISLLYGQLVRGTTAAARVFQYLNTSASIGVHGGHIIPDSSLLGNVEFTDVSFSYPTRPQQEVLSNFSLHIPAGHVVALCGPSGSGKSTIAALLERFYDVDGGGICVDGVDIKSLDSSWLHGNVLGFISQEPVLFHNSIMENIRYGKPDATDSQVIESAKLANADEFIRSLPSGYQTMVGERGIAMSGGQKQRIAIARALIKNPNILILDEATSALDTESEHIVQLSLEKAMKGRTTLVIAHRLSTIKNAHTIAVLVKGKVVETGNHETLKKKGGVYYSLIQKQEEDGHERNSG